MKSSTNNRGYSGLMF